eukprot:5683423-Pyramimonas_sp.AAC.1
MGKSRFETSFRRAARARANPAVAMNLRALGRHLRLGRLSTSPQPRQQSTNSAKLTARPARATAATAPRQ